MAGSTANQFLQTTAAIFIATALLQTMIVCVDASDSSAFNLVDHYAGASFFSGFTFLTSDWWGCQGAAHFVDYAQAQSFGLIRAVDGQAVFIGAESKNVYGSSGRPTVVIASKKMYTGGLFIGDFAHMPTGCGVWPSFWTTGPSWPQNGEIDIIEGVHVDTINAETLHTKPGCVITTEDRNQMTGKVTTTNCSTVEGSNGCSVQGPANSYGTPFNRAGGGVYATEWNAASYIKTWYWPRNQVPADIIAKRPNPAGWGKPYFYKGFGPSCPNTYFQQHQITVDIFLCGVWAGQADVWRSQCAAQTKSADCVSWVQKNPANFTEAYWSINYIDVYQQQHREAPWKVF